MLKASKHEADPENRQLQCHQPTGLRARRRERSDDIRGPGQKIRLIGGPCTREGFGRHVQRSRTNRSSVLGENGEFIRQIDSVEFGRKENC